MDPEMDREMDPDIGTLYHELTDGLTRSRRVSELVYDAAERFPGLVPTRAEIAAERTLPQRDKAGLEIAQGDLLARVLAEPRCGLHLIHSMSRPTTRALALLADYGRAGAADLGPVRVDRDGPIGLVTIQNHAFLNSEDDVSTAALEVAVDLVLLDDEVEVGVLRGGPATHPKHAGRRVFGSGVNLTHLHDGQISLVEFMIDRELGSINKMYRGHALGPFDEHDERTERGRRREKPWIAAVDSFAIGGACQWLLIMDRVIAETGSYFNLPARKEGIIPGCANLRLPRLVGERLARRAIFFNHEFLADRPDGALLADEVVPGEDVEAAIEQAAAELTAAGRIGLSANRAMLRMAQEPLDRFRVYMSAYAREQAKCLYSSALIDNLERSWAARRRAD
jgi:thioesterase DpgC